MKTEIGKFDENNGFWQEHEYFLEGSICLFCGKEAQIETNYDQRTKYLSCDCKKRKQYFDLKEKYNNKLKKLEEHPLKKLIELNKKRKVKELKEKLKKLENE